MASNYPLMQNNISRQDLDLVIKHLKQSDPILTQGKLVNKFEKNWSKWLGVKYSVFVNSGSSANLLSMSILREMHGSGGEIIVPPLTWVSDISSVIQNGFKPVFADINFKNLCMNEDHIFKLINSRTKAVFITYAQGFNGLSDKLLKFLKKKSIPLIEDVCESHGAKFKSKKLGSYGLMSNFSFYYAHHMSTIEGGMVCTNSEKIYQMLRMLRAHGMVRESNSDKLKKTFKKNYPDLNEKFIFAFPSYNMRNNEIGAIIGINQLKKLNNNIKIRNFNHRLFLEKLDKNKYFTEFDLSGSSNYAFNLILREDKIDLVEKLIKIMEKNKIEFRRGSAGGGNQLRQPYLRKYIKNKKYLNYKKTEHIHFYGFYIGNYPSLSSKKILKLCSILNDL